MPIANPLLENTNVSLPYGQAGSAQATKDSLSKTYLSTDEANELSNFFGINPFDLDISNVYKAAGTPVKTDNFGMFDYSDAYNNRGKNAALSMGSTFGAVTGKTAAGTEYVIPQFTTEIDQGKINRTTENRRYQYATGKTALQAQGEALQQWYTHAREYAEAAERRDIQSAQDAQSGAFTNIATDVAAGTREFIDAETVSPDETEGMFSDLAGYTGTGGGSRPDAGTGAFYDRTADQQQSTLDAYAGDTSQGVRMDPRLADATVQGQVQIRNDITGAVDSINAQAITSAVSLLSGLGIPTSDLEGPILNADGTVSYRTKTGKDLSSIITNLASSIEDKIAGVAGETVGKLGYGGRDQDTLFSDIAGLGTAIGEVRTDIGGISTLDQQDVQSALSTQFGDLTTEIQTVGTAVGDVQTTVDDVEAAVGVLDERQLDIVQDLADLGLDTDSIIDALGRVETAVGAGGTLEGQIASKAAGIQQAVSGLGGQVTSGFGAQESQISGLEGGASATALSQVAGDLGDIQEGQATQAETLGTLATAQGQQDLATTVEQVKTATEGVDAAIKNNVVPEFKEIFEIFDDQGNLLTNVQTATGNIQTSVDANGDVLIEKFSDIGGDIANIDLSNLDESAQLATLTSTIGNAAATFTKDYSSMETNIASDRAAILKAIQDDSSALDTLIDTGIPQSIQTEFGTYEAKIGENNELLVTKIDTAIGFDPADAEATRTAAETAASEGSTIRRDLTTVATDAGLAKQNSAHAKNKAARIETIAKELKGDEAAITALINNKTATIEGETLKLNNQNQLIIEDTEGIEGLPGTIETTLGVRFDSVDGAVNGLENLDSNAITAAVEASTITSTLSGVAADAATAAGLDLTTIESTVADIKAGNIATLGELDDSEITALANAVGYNASDLVSSVNEGRLSQDDLTALSTLTSDDITNAVDLSGVATSAQVSQVGTAVQGQAVSLGNIDNIKGDVTTLLAKAEEDLAANTARDAQISGVREDMLDALDDEIRANEAVVRNLLAGQTQTIQGDLDTYTVSFDRESGKLTAQAIDRQTLALGADIDAGTRQLTTDATTNTNYLERKVLEAKERVEGKIGTAFDQNGELISSGLTANGEEIQRVLDAEGKLTETVIATNGTVKDTIVTNLSTVLDDTGKLNQAAIELAQQGSDIEQKQTYFNALGGLIREDVDAMGRRITREIDSSGQFINETLYYEDGSRRGTRILRIQDILDKIFPSDPLAQPEDLTASDRRFLQGFRSEGLMGFG